MALFRVANERAQFDAASNDARDQYGAGIRFTQEGNARVTTSAGTFYNQGIPMSGTGQVAIVDATAGLPSGTIYHNGLPMSGDKVCVSKNATAVVSNGLPFDSAGALAADINFDLNFIGTDTLNSSVTFTRASTATYFNSAGVLQSAANNVPRFDYNPATLAARGLLIEEQRTNSIRNNTMQGAVAGTPGTLPTNWVSSTTAGVSVNVVGTGTESGITYIDVQFVGTPLATGQALVGFDGFANMTATPAATYTGSLYIRRSSGSNTNIGAIINQLVTRDSGGVNIGAQAVDITSTVGAANIRTNRPTNTFTTPALTAFIQHDVRIGFTNGLAIDITLRIGLPQLEQGAFATSVIPTTTTTLTRSADVASVNTLSPWYNATEGTLFAEVGSAPVNTILQVAYELNDNLGGGLGRISTRRTASQIVSTAVTSGGVVQSDISVGTVIAAGATYKVASAFKTNDFAITNDGLTPVTSSSGTLPNTIAKLFLGQNYLGGQSLNGYLRRITYYPVRLTNAALQQITT